MQRSKYPLYIKRTYTIRDAWTQDPEPEGGMDAGRAQEGTEPPEQRGRGLPAHGIVLDRDD